MFLSTCAISLSGSPQDSAQGLPHREAFLGTLSPNSLLPLPLTFFYVTVCLTALRSTYQLTHYSPDNEHVSMTYLKAAITALHRVELKPELVICPKRIPMKSRLLI